MVSKKILGRGFAAACLTGAIAMFGLTSPTVSGFIFAAKGVNPVDDVITVKAGVDERLFILRNDQHPTNLHPGAIRLISQPICGTVEQSGAIFVYRGSSECSGHQLFDYCLSDGKSCKSASVALRLIDQVAQTATIEVNPEQVSSGLADQVAINRSDLEISNVHLGRSAGNEPPLTIKKGAKLAAVAVETVSDFKRPEFSQQTLRLAQEPQTEIQSTLTNTFKDVADLNADSDVQTDAVSLEPIGLVALPFAPEITMQAGQTTLFPVVNLAQFDDGFSAPLTDLGLEVSPFGTPCSPQLTSNVKSLAIVQLHLKAPCQPNTRVKIRHGKVAFTMKTGHSGVLVVDIPAFEEVATFQVRLQNGKRLNTSAHVPDLKNFERLAIQWKGDFDLTLHALEFGAEPGSDGHVIANQPSPLGKSKSTSGFTTRLGDLDVEMPSGTEIYSLPTGPNSRSGVVEMIVSATGDKTTCGTEQVLRSFLSKAGRMVVASGYVFKIPPCGDETRSIVLKNAVRDLIIASN